VVSKLTALPFSVPAWKSFIALHVPLYRYLVSLPPHSVSAYWSITSDPAEVKVVAKSAPRPISM
jgi:hypothetical protein